MEVEVARGFTPFIGRDTEMSALHRAVESARQHHGQIVAVIGEPGVGKSRLFWELTHSRHAHGALILESASLSHAKATAYLPLANLFRAYFQISSLDDARRVAEKITGKVLTLDRELEPHLPPLMALLDVPIDDRGWTGLEANQRRRQTLDAARRLLVRESQNQPVVVIFEDLHWLDSETQAFLDGLVDSLPTARMLLLVNYRPEYRHSWNQKTYYTQLRLDPLQREGASELLGALLGSNPTLDHVKSHLIEKTEGNPFFLEECVRTLVETGAIEGERGAYRPRRAIGDLQVPGTVQAVLAARIDRLDPGDKRLLQAAAVIGQSVPFALLEAIADLPDDALRRGLARLQTGEFVYEARLFPDLEYTFKHALTHTVAYQSLLRATRQDLHGRVARAIQDSCPEVAETQPEVLAHHLTECGRIEEAVAEWERAGDYAVARPALVEAITHFRKALGVLSTLPESRGRSRQELAISLKLGSPLTATRGYGVREVFELYSRACALRRHRRDRSAVRCTRGAVGLPLRGRRVVDGATARA